LRERPGRVVAAIVVVIAPILVTFMGCADVLGIVNGRYVGASDANESGSAYVDDGGPWGCLGLPAQKPDPNAQITVNVFGYNAYAPVTYAGAVDGGSDLILTTYTPITGVPIRYCQLIDPTCTASASPFQVSDDAGGVTFTLPGDFNGFFDLEPPGLIPEALYPGPLAVGQSVEEFFGPLESIMTASLTSMVLHVPVALGVDSGLGQIFIGALDCNDHEAAGVVFTLSNSQTSDASTLIFYNRNGVPSSVATATDDTQGGGGAINVPPGEETVTATLAASSSTLDAATSVTLGSAGVVVRAGGIVFLFMRVKTSH
jgi:hypothetical protein